MSGAAQRWRTLTGLAWKGVRRRTLGSALTILSVALGTGLAVTVATAAESAEDSYASLADASRSFDLVLGPPQVSSLQIVLVTLFHVDVMEGTIPWTAYEEIRKDGRVAAAVPFAVGDTFRGHRVVGTSREFFDVLHGADGKPLGADVRGRLFEEGVNFEVVVGSFVAASTGVRTGDELQVTHGVGAEEHEHAERWKVVGVMRPTGTPHDRAVFIPIDTFYEIEGHGETGSSERSLSAIGLRLKTRGLMALRMWQEIRADRKDAQAVMPALKVRDLRAIVGQLDTAFRTIAWLVIGVVLLGILVALWNTIQGRRRELAILRALGARPHHVFAVIVLEAVLLCVLGGLLGLLVGRGGASLAAPLLQEQYGVRIDASLRPFDGVVLLAVVGLGVLAGAVPAWRGLRTPVAENLHPTE